MGHRHHHSTQSASRHPAAGSPPPRRPFDIRAQLLGGLQQFFEASRDQFDHDDLVIPEWRQADAALERAYDASAMHDAIPAVKHLCDIARRYIEIAVDVSLARSHYDGRL